MFSVGVEESRNGRSLELGATVKETASDGSFEMELYEIDQNPRPEDLGDIAQLDLDILESGMLEVIDRTTLGLLTDDGTSENRLLGWSDEVGVFTTLTQQCLRSTWCLLGGRQHWQQGAGEPHSSVRLGSGPR